MTSSGRLADFQTTLKSYSGERHIVTTTVQKQLGVVGKRV